MRSRYVLIAVVLVALAFGVGRLSAAPGTLDSPDVPANTQSYTLEDIYNRLDTGAAGAQSTFTEPAAGPGTGTMHDLNQIMAQAPAIDNTNGATETNVLDGKTFWGLTGGQWGTQPGTMPDNGAVTITPTTTNQAIAMGYHNGSGEVVGETNLVSGNIKSGVTIFGVAGDPMVVNTSSGTATASDILSDTVAYVDGLEITGTMTNNVAVTIVPTTTNQAIAAGYHNGFGEVLGDTDLVSGNIRSTVSIFGVDGDPNVVDTSSGDATAGEILQGKKAWVDGSEVTGTLPNNTRVPKTGQTTCWDPTDTIPPIGPIGCAGTGQDGEYQLGVSPKQEPPGGTAGAYTVYGWAGTRFTDNGDGTVSDNLTGLIWLENANCAGANKNWSTALSYSNALYDGCTDCFGTSGDCGLSDGSSVGDWRLPNVNELHSLVDLTWTNPALPDTAGTGQWSEGDPFNDVQSTSLYWSSTTYAFSTGDAWDVYLGNGLVNNAVKTVGFYVWPVRGGQ